MKRISVPDFILETYCCLILLFIPESNMQSETLSCSFSMVVGFPNALLGIVLFPVVTIDLSSLHILSGLFGSNFLEQTDPKHVLNTYMR